MMPYEPIDWAVELLGLLAIVNVFAWWMIFYLMFEVGIRWDDEEETSK